MRRGSGTCLATAAADAGAGLAAELVANDNVGVGSAAAAAARAAAVPVAGLAVRAEEALATASEVLHITLITLSSSQALPGERPSLRILLGLTRLRSAWLTLQ